MKIITLGSPGAGKVQQQNNLDLTVTVFVLYMFINRMTLNQFNENYMATIGVEFAIKRTYVNNEPVKMQIWDTAGLERRFKASISAYYRGASGIFFVFDITSEDSFQDVQEIYGSISLQQFQGTMDETKNMNLKIKSVLIGCKNDLESRRAVSYHVAMAFAEKLGMHYIETSAKLGTNYLEAADHLARLCYGQIKNLKVEDSPKLIQPQLETQKKTTCC